MPNQATPELRDKLRDRADGRCECTMRVCGHNGRCTAILRGPWEAHRRTAGGDYSMTNCLAMCQTCHRNTHSYGRG
jgi:hypothetical protein